jgi:hypothetical protein
VISAIVDARSNLLQPRALTVVAIVLLLLLGWFTTCRML